jgi:hypothetical protein
MDEYMEALKESFPYGETVKGSEPFLERYKIVEKNMKRMHQAPAVPVVPAPTTTSASTDNLPATIGSKGTPSRTLPAVIVPKASSNAAPSNAAPSNAASSNAASSNATSKVLPVAPKALPAVMTPISTSANILNVMASNRSNIPSLKAPKTLPAVIAKSQMGGTLKTSSPTSGGWLWNGI